MSKSQPKLHPPRWTIQSYVLGAILVLLFIAVLGIIRPFFTALLWAILLYILLSPLHRMVIKNLSFDTIKGKILRNVWAGVFTLGTLVIILLPITFGIRIFFQQLMDLSRHLYTLLNERPEYLSEFIESIAEFVRNISAGQIPITADEIILQLNSLVSALPQQALHLSGNIARNVGGFSLGLLLISFSVFFFFIDGPYLARLVLRAIPIKTEYISALTGKFKDITRNLLFGYIIVAALQSVIAFIIFSIFGINGSLVFAVLTFILVFIPMFGATIIWIPLGILRIASGDIAGGVIFMIVSMVFISGTDNILRPFFLKDRIQLHPLIIFFAILGGIFTMGINGFILGPMVVIFFLTVLDLFLAEHKIGSQEQADGGEQTDEKEKQV
ncbi:MAG: AI-2E family transporter [Treponema sp.]|nr:AI-2E family transporter [Treponema sp.]